MRNQALGPFDTGFGDRARTTTAGLSPGAPDAPVSMQLHSVAGEQVAVAVGDAGNGARDGAVGRVALALVGGVLPEPPAATGPRVGHHRILTRVGQPQVALGEDGVGTDRLAQPD